MIPGKKRSNPLVDDEVTEVVPTSGDDNLVVNKDFIIEHLDLSASIYNQVKQYDLSSFNVSLKDINLENEEHFQNIDATVDLHLLVKNESKLHTISFVMECIDAEVDNDCCTLANDLNKMLF